jgi:hypothetical protein
MEGGEGGGGGGGVMTCLDIDSHHSTHILQVVYFVNAETLLEEAPVTEGDAHPTDGEAPRATNSDSDMHDSSPLTESEPHTPTRSVPHTHSVSHTESVTHTRVSAASLNLLCDRFRFLNELFSPAGMDVMVVVSRDAGRTVPVAAVDAALVQVRHAMGMHGSSPHSPTDDAQDSSVLGDRGDGAASSSVTGPCDFSVEGMLDAVLSQLAEAPEFR